LVEATPDGYFEPATIISEAARAERYDVVVWMLDRLGRPSDALAEMDSAAKAFARKLVGAPISNTEAGIEIDGCRRILELHRSLIRMAARVCQARSHHGQGIPEQPAEDSWFELLRSQIEVLQIMSGGLPSRAEAPPTLDYPSALRDLLRETFSQFISQLSTQDLSFPRLFKRLVDSATKSRDSSHAFYAEFRSILSGMLDSYRSEGDFLLLSNRVVKQDLAATLVENVRARSRGWRLKTVRCADCKQGVRLAVHPEPANLDVVVGSKLVLLRAGVLLHEGCQAARCA
jgi:hypothetical protein